MRDPTKPEPPTESDQVLALVERLLFFPPEDPQVAARLWWNLGEFCRQRIEALRVEIAGGAR